MSEDNNTQIVQDQDPQAQTQTGDDKMLNISQTEFNRIIQERLSRERSKYSDYDELSKFKSEHEKNVEVNKQKELEAQREYEKLKEGWGTKENEYKNIIAQKEQSINDMMIENALTSEVLKQNAYNDAIALVKSSALLRDGKVFIKGKDSNGMDTELSVEDGVKSFLESKPYLVKSTARSGSGTGASVPQVNQNGNPTDLTQALLDAKSRGDYRKVQEIKNQIRAKNNL